MKRLFQDLKRYRIAFLIGFISLIALYIIYLTSSYVTRQDEIRREFVKLLIQLLLIVIFGGIFVQWYNLRSDRAKALNEFRKNFLTKLTDSYFKVKKARRILEGIVNKMYLFRWGEIPGEDSVKFIEFLKQKYGIDWIKEENIKKSDDKTIKVSNENKSLSLRLNNEKTKVDLKIDDGRTDEFIVKKEKENGKLNINIYNKNKENSYSVYETQIIEIIDAQLEFESLHNQLAIRLFYWDNIPTKGEIPTNSEEIEIEMTRLKNFLKQETGLDWVNGAKIEKIDNCRLGNTIKVSVEKNYLLLSLNNEENKMNLKIQGGPIRNQFFNYLGYIIKRNEFVVIKEHGKIFKVIPYIFSDKNTYRLIKLTRKIESKLNDKIINEYKKPTTTDSTSIAELDGIRWLINTEGFRNDISYPFHECVELIQGEILNI